MSRFWLLLGVLLCAPAPAQVTIDAVPGGLAEIPLAPSARERPRAYFGRKEVLVMRVGHSWTGLVGLPLELVPGSYVLQARLDGEEQPVVRTFTVYPKRFDAHPVVDYPFRPPGPGDLALEWRDALDADLPLQAPVPSPAQPLFGRYRDSSDREAGYVDFVAFTVTADTSIAAPGNGRVARVDTQDIGAYIWIDHGMGMFSRLGPVTRAAVRRSDTVEAGQSVGRMVLETVDDPRPVYWSVFLNGAAVNPFLVSDLASAPLNEPGDNAPD